MLGLTLGKAGEGEQTKGECYVLIESLGKRFCEHGHRPEVMTNGSGGSFTI